MIPKAAIGSALAWVWLGGAIVGTSLGVLIPSLHGTPVALVPTTAEGQRGVALGARV